VPAESAVTEDARTEIDPPVYSTVPSHHPRKRRRRRRPWFQRPLLMVPLALLLLVAAGAGTVAYRASSTMATLHTVTTPPPVVTDATFDEDASAAASPIHVETGPAREALRAAQTTGNQHAPVPDRDQGGIFGRVRQVAASTGDLASGAVTAAGLKTVPHTPAQIILLMGVDAQPGAPIDIGVRPDALILLRLDPDTRSCRLLAIPRDTRVDLPGYGESKINHALMVGGIPYQQLVVEQFTGLSVDHYLLIDFVAFQQIVDAVGGVPVTVPEDLVKDGQVRFTAGTHHFDGKQALAYARYRNVPDGNIGRVKRQWGILQGLSQVESGRDLVGDVNQLLPALEDHIRTDLTATEMAGIARTYGNHCNADSTPTTLIDGTQVRLHDPILQQTLYYNVVAPAVVKQRVTDFSATPGFAPASPAASNEPQPRDDLWRERLTPF
jgi:LCP family protein required for cell wall assembly